MDNFFSMPVGHDPSKAAQLICKQADKITALEKRLSNAETMGDKAQSIRDLEQQAKGLKDFSITYNEMATNPDLLVNLLNYCANVLLGKAKALKEGK
jgi:hypothetical protein